MEEKKVLARLTGLVGELDSLKDFRVQGRTKHPLKTVVAIAIASTASVGDGYTQMEDFARRHEEFLKERLPMPNGVPSHDTFRRVISRLNAKMLERILSRWLTRQCGGLGGELVALDGKTLRRSAGEGGGRRRMSKTRGATPSARPWRGRRSTRSQTKSPPRPGFSTGSAPCWRGRS